MSFYAEARKYNAAVSRLSTLTGREAERKRRYHSANKANPLRSLVVIGTSAKTHVDAAAHAAAEAGAGFAQYTGVQQRGAGGDGSGTGTGDAVLDGDRDGGQAWTPRDSSVSHAFMGSEGPPPYPPVGVCWDTSRAARRRPGVRCKCVHSNTRRAHRYRPS
jgi:hypothetical protein